MKGLTMFFSLAFTVSLLARILFGYYVYKVPVFGSLLTLLTWLSVAFGILMVLFVVLIVINAFKRNKED